MGQLSSEMIRAARAENTKIRDRDLAAQLGIREADLVAASVGIDVTRIDPHPDAVMGAARQLGDVMALTRNDASVHEKVGVYEEYHSGHHASMVLGPEIDLRIFPSHWCHAFMVDREGKRSIQIFDAAGDAVHKIFLREQSDHSVWQRLMSELAVQDQSEALSLSARIPVEPAKPNIEKLDALKSEWARMTDTHQFLRLVSKLKMNRLGAYRIVGQPFARRVASHAVDEALGAVQAEGIGIMVFVGNHGCIQIHQGPIQTLKSVGPWQNVLDRRFNLHLRLDKIAEAWVVNKPTKRGDAVSLEAFDKDGGIILQMFGVPKKGDDSRKPWQSILKNIETLEEQAVS